MTRIRTTLLALAATAAIAPAALSETSNRNQFTVDYTDLDLDSRHDAGVLLERIEKAAGRACKDWESVVPRDELACRERTVQMTVSGVDNATLSRVYESHKTSRTLVAQRD